MKTALLAAVVLVLGFEPAPWTPPIGIPTPPFGLTEVAGPPTLVVDASKGQTIPSILPPCTVVQIVGRYDRDHASPRTIEARGTRECPVFITGGEQTATWEVSGQFLIIEKARRGFLVIRATPDGRDTHDITIRDSEFVGGGVGVQATFSPTGSVFNVVLLRLNIHDLGNMDTTADEDVVGVGIYRERNHHVWFLDSRCERVSSDCFQANAQGDPAGVHHIYAGRITCRNNRQGCLWAKQSEDVVFSESSCSQMRPDKGGLNPGQCFGAQYDARRLVIVKNQMSNSENGIVLGSFDYATPHGGILIAGNLITNIHHTTSADAIENPWSGGAAIRLSGGVTALVANNTIWDVDGGIQIPAGGATTTLLNNIIGKTARAVLQVEQRERVKQFAYHVLTPAPVFAVGGSVTTGEAEALALGRNVLAADLRFQGAADFRLKDDSPAKRAGLPLDLTAAYQMLHGVPLGLELTGTPDIGAGLQLAELPTPAPSPPPACTFWRRLFRLCGQ